MPREQFIIQSVTEQEPQRGKQEVANYEYLNLSGRTIVNCLLSDADRGELKGFPGLTIDQINFIANLIDSDRSIKINLLAFVTKGDKSRLEGAFTKLQTKYKSKFKNNSNMPTFLESMNQLELKLKNPNPIS
jgi:hypothetical protein